MKTPRHCPNTVLESLEGRRLLHGDPALSADNFGISASKTDYTDPTGLTWEAARGFSNSPTAQTVKSANPIAGTTLDTLFRSTRQDFNLKFSTTVPDGAYSVSMYFAEQSYTHAGDRVFTINVQGHRALTHFDIFKAAGGEDKAVVETFTANVTDGTLTADFLTGATRASINAIRVEPYVEPASPSSSTLKVGKISWSTKASAPIKREESVSFVSGGKLYAIGGYINGDFQATRRVDVYDPATNKWTRLNDAPTKITHTGLAVDPKTGIVWMIGGFIGDFPEPSGTNVVWKYDPKHDRWTQGPKLPVSRGAGGSAIVDNKLYFISGSTADRASDSGKSYVLDLGDTDDGWKAIATIPTARNHFGTIAVGSKIFVIGGQTGLEAKSVAVGSVYVYDTDKNAWFKTTSMPKAYSHFTSTIALYKGRYILLAGGENPHNTALSDVMLFDTLTRTWIKLTSLPDVRRAAVGGIIGNKYVVSGGYKYRVNQLSSTWTADLTELDL